MNQTVIRSSRLLASAAAVALAGGLFAAPAASAKPGPGVSAPAVLPSPGFAATGAATDACDDTTTPGWISTTSPTLTALAASPAARFAVWDEAGDKVFDDQAATGTDGTARIRPTGLADGHTYSWQAWPEYQPGSGKPTATCHFRVDTTVPAVPTVSSTDFPSSGTAQKYAGQTGTFTLTGTDQGSGVACFQYVLNGTLSVAWTCQSPGTVAADGNLQLKVGANNWGTNVLTVQAMDNAGNVSQPVTYTFYAPSNPNPPGAPGDVNGDGTPDILLPDSTGKLDLISADASTTFPRLRVPATAVPVAGTTWSGYQIAHRGWLDIHAPEDDVFVHGRQGAALYVYRNFNNGQFNGSEAMLVSRPTSCGDTACPADYRATDWSQVDQLVSLGTIDNTNAPALVTEEGGNLWLFAYPDFSYGFYTVQKLSTNGAWAGYDIIAPGKAADGTLALWARDRATGDLRTYPIPLKADGTGDFSALADPASGKVIGNFPAATYPTLGSSGDGDGDGRPDLYAVTADRHLLTFHGVGTPKDLGVLR